MTNSEKVTKTRQKRKHEIVDIMVGYGGYLLFVFLRRIVIDSANLHSRLFGGLIGAEVIIKEENVVYTFSEFFGRSDVYLRIGFGG